MTDVEVAESSEEMVLEVAENLDRVEDTRLGSGSEFLSTEAGLPIGLADENSISLGAAGQSRVALKQRQYHDFLTGAILFLVVCYTELIYKSYNRNAL